MSLALSIVIPTHGRSHLVEKLLASIASDAAIASGEVEILVVDDSLPADAERIAAAVARHGAILVRSPTANVGGKRNLGAIQAKHPQILFLDSDVTIRKGTLQAHFNRLVVASPEVAACLGKVEFEGEETLAWRVMKAMQLTLPFAYPDFFDSVPWGPTANLSVKREAFLEIGGFDVQLTHYGGEDVDLGLRWREAGKRIVTAPDAVVLHAIETWSTWDANLRRLWSFGKADYHLLERHSSRGFIDFPTGPMLWISQSLLSAVLVGMSVVPLGTGIGALAVAILAYPLSYAVCKRKPGEQLIVHILGPLVFWTMDAAKAVEALRHRRPSAIFRRLLFLDDLIAQDWREVAASAWGLTASAFAFAAVLLLGKP